ncbi:MAG: phosphatase PAP2 family protein [Chloroflexota bacterium]
MDLPSRTLALREAGRDISLRTRPTNSLSGRLKWWHQRGEAASGLAFVGVAGIAALGGFRAVDTAVTSAVAPAAPCLVVAASQLASLAFAAEICAVYGVVLSLVLFFRQRPVGAAAVLMLLAGTVGIELACKWLVFQPGPGAAMLGISRPDCPMIPYPLTQVPASVAPNSLPSGFATRAAFFGALLLGLAPVTAPGTRRWLTLATVAGVSLVGASRVVILWHWPSDILAGILLGAALGMLALRALAVERAQTTAVYRRGAAALAGPLLP